MLKRLFISLIILSTLATEGILNIPVNICNILTYLNTEAQQNKNSSDIDELAKDLKVNSNYPMETFNLSFNSYLKPGLRENNNGFQKLEMGFIRGRLFTAGDIFLSKDLADETTLRFQKNNFLFKTGTSPPMV